MDLVEQASMYWKTKTNRNPTRVFYECLDIVRGLDKNTKKVVPKTVICSKKFFKCSARTIRDEINIYFKNIMLFNKDNGVYEYEIKLTRTSIKKIKEK